ncbi:MAG TPA: carboxypeptidase-like regulatory domain-containing protein [Candidatus Acidoferrales bacterium]|nr:carboxypeptidase-like regulatory domain-containing protein [Candidatus Acidoferrales bacterium]
MLAFLPVAAAKPATLTSSPKHTLAGQHHKSTRAKAVHPRHATHKKYLIRTHTNSGFELASVRIPERTFSAIVDASPLPAFPDDSVQNQNELRLPRQSARKTAALQGAVTDSIGRGIIGAVVALTNRSTGMTRTISTDADGVFRWTDLAPGNYLLLVQDNEFESVTRDNVTLEAGDVVTLELTLSASAISTTANSRLPRMPELGLPAAIGPAASSSAPYSNLRRRPDAVPGQEISTPEALPPSQEVFLDARDRWNVAMPEWNRYGRGGEYPYVRASHWWDPFNRNRLKGDVPIWGQQTFLNVTATSDTFADERRVPSMSNISSARPGSSDYFGRGEHFALSQTFRFSFDLFHGDASFRPVDWRIQVTPAVNVNYLNVRELGIVNIDVTKGTTRVDAHVGLQEAFVEYKIHDLSANYDFLSVRAGIQSFSSDFRGFLFVDEQPGVRFFGNLHSNRWEYNAAYFNLLEKDTNSGLNTFQPRHQQVIVANVYTQDFVRPGYTTEFSIHYNKDDASVHYDDNGFLVRPAPVGVFQPHEIRAAYLGWTGNGHFGRINVNHAFYEALGTDSLNPIAGRPVTINAQMGAAEVSLDRNWIRYKVSAFYASGDGNPRDGRATGFDTIVDDPAFAGGIFSFWDREELRLPGTGIALTPGNSLLPSMRTNKEEGQANFVNPGIFLVNAGANFDLTPKLKTFLNVNYLRFVRTGPIALLLFESPIHNTIGVDTSVGFQYRPPLSENISITGGAAALFPGQGFRDIFSGTTQFSLFANVHLQF